MSSSSIITQTVTAIIKAFSVPITAKRKMRADSFTLLLRTCFYSFTSTIRFSSSSCFWSIAEGASPVISYNYGARKPDHVKKSIAIMSLLPVIYMVIAWGIILIAPGALISVFSSDSSLISDSIPALKIYFAAFAFMLLQYIGQTTFKSLNKNKQAIFFSLLR